MHGGQQQPAGLKLIGLPELLLCPEWGWIILPYATLYLSTAAAREVETFLLPTWLPTWLPACLRALPGQVMYSFPAGLPPDLASQLAAFCFPHGVRPGEGRWLCSALGSVP